MQQMFVSKVFELLLKHKFADFKQKDMYIVSLLRVTYGIISIFFKKKPKTLSSSCKREKLRNIVPCLEENLILPFVF